METRRVFFQFGIFTNVLVISCRFFEYLCYGSTAFRNIFTLKVRWSTSDVRFWRLRTSDSDFYKRQILTSTDIRFWRLKSIPSLSELTQYRVHVACSLGCRPNVGSTLISWFNNDFGKRPIFMQSHNHFCTIYNTFINSYSIYLENSMHNLWEQQHKHSTTFY